MNRIYPANVLTFLEKKSIQLKKTHYKNILLINLKYLGDLVVCSAAIRALKKSFPEASVSFLVRNEYKDVLKGNPNLTEIIYYDSAIKKMSGFKRFFAELSYIRFIRSKKYDAVISLQAGDRYVIWSWLSGAKVRVGPIQNNLGFLLTSRANVLEEKTDYMNYYLKIVERFGAQRDGIDTEFQLSPGFENWANEILVKSAVSKNDLLIGIHPGASEPTKVWPFENFQETISQLTSDTNVKVVVFLGPAEQKNKYQLSNFGGNVFIVDTSEHIQQLAWMVSRCSLVICNDSGTRHLSAALKIPTITLFPEDKILPWKFYTEEQKQFFIIGKRNTNSYKKSFLDGIEVGDVVNKAKQILGMQ